VMKTPNGRPGLDGRFALGLRSRRDWAGIRNFLVETVREHKLRGRIPARGSVPPREKSI
jgi:hypothetical protein